MGPLLDDTAAMDIRRVLSPSTCFDRVIDRARAPRHGSRHGVGQARHGAPGDPGMVAALPFKPEHHRTDATKL